MYCTLCIHACCMGVCRWVGRCVCMYVCVHACMYICVQMGMYMCGMRAWVINNSTGGSYMRFSNMCMHVWACVHMCGCICARVMRMHVCMHACMMYVCRQVGILCMGMCMCGMCSMRACVEYKIRCVSRLACNPCVYVSTDRVHTRVDVCQSIGGSVNGTTCMHTHAWGLDKVNRHIHG
jgi:hypothetical protein